MKAKYILFDFDGTIADSSEGVFMCVLYALENMGRPLPGRDELRKFIGPPLRESFSRRCGMTPEETERAVELYRRMYSDTGILKCRVYDGVEKLLSDLRAKGFILAVATSKPEVYARRILDHFGLSRYFTYIAGAEFSGARTDKPAVIEYALKSLGADASEAIMIGDRFHDVEGAHRFGVKCVGVLWGFGSREEFEKCGADFICADTEEVERLLTGDEPEVKPE